MAATAQSSHYHREERSTFGQPAYGGGGDRAIQQNNWDSHLDGLLTDLKQSLPPSRTAPVVRTVTDAPLPLSADLSVPADLAGSEDFHERNEFTSPDRSTHTVEERSRRTERTDAGSRVVTRKVVRSQSSNRTTERCTISPEPVPALTIDTLDTTGVNSFRDKRETSVNQMLSPPIATAPSVSGTQSHMSRYECRSSERSVSPAALPPRRQPPPSPSASLRDASTVTATGLPPPPTGATTINYHIYNYGTETMPDSGVGTLERTGRWQQDSLERNGGRTWQQDSLERSGERRWQNDSLDRQVVGQNLSPPQRGPPASPGTPGTPVGTPGTSGDHLYSRSVTTEVHRTAGDRRPVGGPGGETLTSQRWEQQRTDGGPARFPVDGVDSVDTVDRVERVERVERDNSSGPSVLVPSKPQDGTYPEGPRRRDLISSGQGQVIEVRSAQIITEPSESASDIGQSQRSQSQSPVTPGVYYPPAADTLNCESKFHTKEKSKEGNKRSHFEASGKYKAKGGSKQTEDKGGKTIPVCLPCCAGAACTIM